MTTINHAVMGFLVSYHLWNNPYFVTTAIILSVIPDISIWYQKLILGRKKEEINWNGFYRTAHTSWWAFLIPFWQIHIFFDLFLHYKDGGANEYYMLIEVITWLIYAIIICNTFFNIDFGREMDSTRYKVSIECMPQSIVALKDAKTINAEKSASFVDSEGALVLADENELALV